MKEESSVGVKAEKNLQFFTLSPPNATFFFISFANRSFLLLPDILDTSFVQNIRNWNKNEGLVVEKVV